VSNTVLFTHFPELSTWVEILKPRRYDVISGFTDIYKGIDEIRRRIPE
jgi:hypothetical protein